MLKSMFFCVGLAAIIAVAGIAQAESMSFSTDFGGTSLPTGLTADAAGIDPTPVTVNDGLTIVTPSFANIWAWGFGGPTVQYSLDSTDSRDFTIEAVLSSRSGTYDSTHSGIIMVFGSGDSIRTGMYGPYNGADTLRYEDNQNQPNGIGATTDAKYSSGTGLSFAERITRHGSNYTFSYKNDGDATWTDVGTLGSAYGFDATGPSWIGLYGSCWGTGTETCTYSSFSFTVVPEPSAMVLLIIGIMGLLAYAWRKRK